MRDLTLQQIHFEDETGEDIYYDIIHYFTTEAGNTYIFTVAETLIDEDEFEDVIPYRVTLDDEGWIIEVHAIETDEEWEIVESEWQRFADESDDWPEEE